MSLGVENGTTEFVDGMEDLDEALRSVAAMLNRYNRADVYIGVGPDGEPAGACLGDEDVETVRRSMESGMNTVPEAGISLETDERGRRYIHVSARGYDIPYSYGGWFRVRRCCITKNGDSLVEEWKNLLTCGMKRHRGARDPTGAS